MATRLVTARGSCSKRFARVHRTLATDVIYCRSDSQFKPVGARRHSISCAWRRKPTLCRLKFGISWQRCHSNNDLFPASFFHAGDRTRLRQWRVASTCGSHVRQSHVFVFSLRLRAHEQVCRRRTAAAHREEAKAAGESASEDQAIPGTAYALGRTAAVWQLGMRACWHSPRSRLRSSWASVSVGAAE